MRKKPAESNISPPRPPLTDDDIYEAMKKIPGYLDITPGDFKEVYRLAYEHALERLTTSVQVRDIMARQVVSVSADAPLAEVAEVMGRNGVSGVPVVDAGGKVVGVISEKDFLVRMGVKSPKNFMSVVAECLQVRKCVALPMRSQRAADIMSKPAVTVGADTPLNAVSRILVDKGINRVPVVDSEGRLIGLVSRADIVKAARQGTAP
ncbi:MAG: CBS domain-containing protein [Deltaproteobacteria bacterium]|nr:CBS domain-containing protein [Deltaproteobacteria bacterium]